MRKGQQPLHRFSPVAWPSGKNEKQICFGDGRHHKQLHASARNCPGRPDARYGKPKIYAQRSANICPAVFFVSWSWNNLSAVVKFGKAINENFPIERLQAMIDK